MSIKPTIIWKVSAFLSFLTTILSSIIVRCMSVEQLVEQHLNESRSDGTRPLKNAQF